MHAASILCVLARLGQNTYLLLAALAFGAFLSMASCKVSAAQSVRIVVPYAAGGGGDRLARLLAPELAKGLRVAVVVENVPGANGIVGMQRVKRAAPHESVLALASEHAAVIAPLIVPSVGYETRRDFITVGLVATFPYVIAVASTSVDRSLRELQTRTHRERALSIAVPADGGVPELIANVVGASELTVVTFRGGHPAAMALVGGQVDAAAVGLSNVLSLYKGGRVRVLAVSGSVRAITMPEVPTFSEVGVPGLGMTSGWILLAPKNTRIDVEALNRALELLLSRPDVKTLMRQFGMEAAPADAGASARELERLHNQWKTLVDAQPR